MNASPIIGAASWSGNTRVATQNQLLSSVNGLYDDLKDFSFSTINVSTINVAGYISTSVLYVSDLQAGSLDISGIIFDASGLLYAPLVSSSQGIFNVTNVSVIKMEFKPTFTGDIKVTFDLGLGQAIGGLLAGLGAAVGGGLIAVGTGVGLAVQGAEQGIATIIAGRPQNFITTNTYETINFTSQLQVSTLGNAYPAYSSIFRTVSSISANEVPGREIFTSTIFYPGQICIRSASDPINLISGDSNLNTSTLQSFGQWVPLEGLEPTNIDANSVSTNFLSSGVGYIDLLTALDVTSFGGLFSNVGVEQSLALNYNAPLLFQTGATNQSYFNGYLQNLYLHLNDGLIFTEPNSITEKASMRVGINDQSELFVCSIKATNIKAVDFYASTITAESITAISTLFITSTNLEVVTVTSTLIADEAYINRAFISSMDSFKFLTGLGNPNGVYDISKIISQTSTTFSSISSLTNNILYYQLNCDVLDQTSYNMGGQGAGTPGAYYAPSPSNVEQWASTLLICNPTNGLAASLNLGNTGLWTSTSFLNGTFDLVVDMTKNVFTFNCYENQNPFNPTNPSTILNIPPFLGFRNTYRFNLQSNGWWTYATPADPPYATVNSNIFTISQDINDVNITTTDRLNLTAGDIFIQGATHIPDLQLTEITLEQVNADNISSLNLITNQAYTNFGLFSSIYTESGDPNAIVNMYWTSNYTPVSILSSFTSNISTTLLNSVIELEKVNSNILQPLGAFNDVTLSKLGSWLINGSLRSDNYYGRNLIFTPVDGTSRIFTDNNGFGLASNLPVVTISNASTSNTINLFINFPSTAIPIGPNSGTTITWSNSSNDWYNGTYVAFPTGFTESSEIDIYQNLYSLTVQSPSTIFTGNLQLNGALSLQGRTITTFIMTWSHEIGAASQHDFGTVPVQDGNGNSYNSAEWRMEFSIYEIELNSVAYAMNSFSLRPNTDASGNYTISWDVYYTTIMLTSFDISYWVDITMYPREMISAETTKNWGLVS